MALYILESVSPLGKQVWPNTCCLKCFRDISSCGCRVLHGLQNESTTEIKVLLHKALWAKAVREQVPSFQVASQHNSSGMFMGKES